MEDSEPGSYAPILVQSMMKHVVEANGSRRAIVSCDGKIDWNYDQYYQELKVVEKILLPFFCKKEYISM